MPLLDVAARAFLDTHRVGHLATASSDGNPSVVPVCYAVNVDSAYVGIDEKPKRRDVMSLRRLTNLRENPRATICVDHYDENWDRLGFVLLRGHCDTLLDGEEHARAQDLLRARYSQLARMNLVGLPVIALRIERVTAWGCLG